MLIINADDFGMDPMTNRAIVYSLERGLCSSASIIPNMSGFEEACQLAHEHKLVNCIGVHLTLSKSYPLSEKIKHFSRFCDKTGKLYLDRLSSLDRLFFVLDASEKAALAEEIRAQIRKCRAYKIPITHLDSHAHLHTAWTVASIVMQVTKEEGIRFIRIARNIGPDKNIFKSIYKYTFNKRLMRTHRARTDYFGSIGDLLFFKRRNDISRFIHSCEIMVHPQLISGHILFDDTNSLELENLLRQIGAI